MAHLIIVAGASGAGKSFLLENARFLDPSIISVQKLTTRGPRSYEDAHVQEYLDLRFSREIGEVTACDYRYPYGDHWYGARRKDIDKVLREGKTPIIILRSCETILRVKEDYPDAVVLYLQSTLSGDDLRARLEIQGREDIEIEKRMGRLDRDFHDYIRHLHYKIFDYVLINNYEKDALLEQLQLVLFETTGSSAPVDPNYIFVLMSFSEDMLESYRAIQTAGKLFDGRSLRVERIDEVHGDYEITDAILECIGRAALVVCDLTESRPNVFYELGFARGMQKTVIHCARQGTPLPFDLKDFRTTFYSSPIDLQTKLTIEIRHFFDSKAS